MRLLLLGGTGDARELALRLHQTGADGGIEVVYSVAGITAPRAMPCTVRRGGFGGIDGLVDYLQRGGFDLLVDATHPYAARISANAVQAATGAGVPLWALWRPPWQAGPGDRWIGVADWEQAARGLRAYRRPLITLGRTPLERPLPVPSGSRWVVRCVPGWRGAVPPRVDLIEARGPFALEDELALLRDRGCDVLVSKNSGGAAVAAKLAACRRLGVPVIMLARPLPAAPAAWSRQFTELEDLVAAVLAIVDEIRESSRRKPRSVKRL